MRLLPMRDRRLRRSLGRRGFRRVVVAIADNPESEQALVAACRLTSGRRSRLAVVTVVEVPVELPLDCLMIDEDARAEKLLIRAQTLAKTRGVSCSPRLKRARQAATGLLEEAERIEAELLVVGAKRHPTQRSDILGRTTATLLKQARCRVLVVTAALAAPRRSAP